MKSIKGILKKVCEACGVWGDFKQNNFRHRANEQKSKFKQAPIKTITELRNNGLDRQEIMLQLNITEEQLQKYWPQPTRVQQAMTKKGRLINVVDPTQEQRELEICEICGKYKIDILDYKKRVLASSTYLACKALNIPDAVGYRLNKLLQLDIKDCSGKNGSGKEIDLQEFLDLYWEGLTTKQLAEKYGMCVRNINKMIQTYREQGTISETNEQRRIRLKANKIKKSK